MALQEQGPAAGSSGDLLQPRSRLGVARQGRNRQRLQLLVEGRDDALLGDGYADAKRGAVVLEGVLLGEGSLGGPPG